MKDISQDSRCPDRDARLDRYCYNSLLGEADPFTGCSTALCWALAAFSSFLILFTVGRTPWTGDQPVARPLPTQTQNKRTQISMPRVGLEPTIPVFKRTKTVHALDCAVTVIGSFKG
jgi:hypothetical protein